MEPMTEVYAGTFELSSHQHCPLLEYSMKTELDIEVHKHFPAYQRELCGVIFNIPAKRTFSEIEALAGENLRIRGVQTYDNSTAIVGTIKDDVTNYVLYYPQFSTVIDQTFHKSGIETITVETIEPVQLDFILEGLVKLVGENNVVYSGTEKHHLIEFVNKPETSPLIISAEENAIVARAIEMGFLDIPRRIDLTELAKELGTSKATLSPKMREIYKKVLKGYTNRVTRM